MKKLLQINPVIKENTSTGKIMRTLGELAQAAGWESYVAYSRARDGVPPHSSRLVPVGNKADLLLHWVATRLFDAHGLASRLATRRFVARLRELNPDVIHIHNIHGYFLNYKILSRALAQMGKPVVWTVHDCWLYTGHCYHYASAGCERWKTGCHHCPQKKAFPASWLLDRSRRNWEDKKKAFCSIPGLTLVTVSRWMKGEIARSFLGRVRCEVIHNGIDLDTFRPSPSAETALAYGTYYLAVASIWLPEKGLQDLEKLSSVLDADERLVVVGKRPSGHRFPRNVVCLERTADAAALAALYTEAVALVNPTWQDNYPTVNMEAIACGTPVVSYRTGGSPESITPQTGRVVEQGDVEGLAEALHAIRRQGKEHFSEACRSYALAHFRAQDRFNDYIQLYESLTTG